MRNQLNIIRSVLHAALMFLLLITKNSFQVFFSFLSRFCFPSHLCTKPRKPRREERKGLVEEEKKSNENNTKRVAFIKLFSFADWKDVGLMFFGTLGAAGNGLSPPLMTLFLGNVINSFGSYTHSSSDMMHQVSKVALDFVYLAVCSGVASFLETTCWMITGERQASRIRGLYLKAILRQDIEFFDTETSTGEVVERMCGDTVLIHGAMSGKVGDFIRCISTFVGAFAIAFSRGWLLSLVLFACIPFVIASGGIITNLLSKIASRAQSAYADAGNVIEQTVGGIRTVVSFNGQNIAIQNYNARLEAAYAATMKQGLVSGIGPGIFFLSMFTFYGLAVWVGSRMIIYHGYNGGTIINVMTVIMMGGMSLSHVTSSLSAFAQGQAAAYKMFATINRKPRIDAYETNNGLILEDMKGEIELKDVYFKYPARPDIQIFSGFSLHVTAGTTVALVGQSGSGKSTIFSLLKRFYDPDAGEVLIDGVNLKKMRLNWLRTKIGLVSQEPILFATTIKENILYGNVNATDAEIKNAIELANAAKFIDKLPMGLDTMVGAHGAQLSGGQKQRIAISRAMLKNPKILLLDEATSALDAESERVVLEALDWVMVNRTTVVVAHRLMTMRNVDQIVVVHAGKLVEKGTHSDLIKDPNGAYSQLMHMQEGSQKDEKVGQQSLDLIKFNTDFDEGLSIRFPHLVHDIKENEAGDYETEDISRDSGMRKNVSILRLAYLNRHEVPQMVIGSIAACGNGVIFPVFGLLMAKAIRIMYDPPQVLKKEAEFWALVYVGLGVMSFLVMPMQNYFFGISGNKLIQRIRSLSFEKVVHQEISFFDDPKNSSGIIGARLSSDASTLKNLVGDALALVVQNISTVIAGLIFSFTTNWKLALIVLALLPFVGLQGFSQMKFHDKYSGDVKAMYEEASQIANDAVGGIRTVAAFCAEDKVMEMYRKKCEGPIKISVKLGLISGATLAAGNFFKYCSNAACFYIGALLVDHGEATFGEVFKVFFSLTMAATGVSQAVGIAPDLGKAKASAVSIFGILDRKSRIDSSSNDGLTLEAVNGDIELKNVCFKYPIRPNIQIFKDLSLSIPSGKMVALVGESGSGKSTIISLIERFYDPDSGKILLDGVDIKRLNINWHRQQIGLVSQEPTLFNETIRDNVAYGKQGNVTEDEIIAATKNANAHNFISSLPQGYDTNVGERGIQLSGGQKQRIAIARAILKNPKILLLDEATSALDAESERIVQDALYNVMVNRTTVVVAHRLSTIRGADVIAVVKNGAISEKGRHEALMRIPNGTYASLVALHSSAE